MDPCRLRQDGARSAAWGHGFPLRANAGEVLARSGHTEAAIDLLVAENAE
jgi:3,4-dihydroxy-2-butanone 4-phosphate synthase